jgi:hypothetical protein
MAPKSVHGIVSDTTASHMRRALRLLLLPIDFSDADLTGAVALNARAVEEVARGMELYALQLNHELEAVSAFTLQLLRTAVRLRVALAGASEAPEVLLRACLRNRPAVEALAVTLDLYAAHQSKVEDHVGAQATRVRAAAIRAVLSEASKARPPEEWTYLSDRLASN